MFYVTGTVSFLSMKQKVLALSLVKAAPTYCSLQLYSRWRIQDLAEGPTG